MDNNIQSRFLDLYNTLLHNTQINYNHTIDTIRQIETGIRAILTQSNNIPQIPSPIVRQNPTLSHNSMNTYIDTSLADIYRNTTSTLNNRNSSNYANYNSRQNRPYRNDIYYGGHPRSNISTEQTRTDRSVRSRRSHDNIIPNRANTTTEERLPNLLSNILLYSFHPANVDNLTPVVVRPTQSDINNATEVIQWDVDLDNDMCPITQETFTVNDRVTRIHHCGHCFKTDAIIRWFSSSVFCPVCRYDIRQYNNSSTNDTSQENEDTATENETQTETQDETQAESQAETVDADHNIDQVTEHNTESRNSRDDTTTGSVSNSTNNPAHLIGETDFNSITRDFLNAFTSQLAIPNTTIPTSATIPPVYSGSRVLNNADISNNLFNMGDIVLEYTIQTPDNSLPLYGNITDSLHNILRDTFNGSNTRR